MEKRSKATRLLGKVIELADYISNNTPHDVFVDYSPHINCVSVRMYEGGWKRDSDPVYLERGINNNYLEIDTHSEKQLRKLLMVMKHYAPNVS